MAETKPPEQGSENIQNQTPAQTAPLPPTKPPFKFNTKILIGLIAIILLTTAAFTSYFVISSNQKATAPQQTVPSPTPDLYTESNRNPTANWKTYTNETLKYVLNYPHNWYAYELKNYPYEGYPGVVDGDEIIITSFTRFPKFSAGDGSGDQYIGMEIQKTEAIQERIKILQEFRYPSGEKHKVEQLSLNGVTAYRVTQLDNDIEWLMSNKNGIDGVSVSILSRSVESNEINTINQILSTFQFLD